MSGKWNNTANTMGRMLAPVSVALGAHTDSDGHALHAPVLVLNASYEPINVCAARRAIVLVLKGVAMTEEENGHFLHAARLAVRLPSVIRLLEYRRIPHQSRALSRKNILLRDRNTCQYCAEVLPSRRTHARSRNPAFSRRGIQLGKSRCLLSSLQSPQRKPVSRRSQHEADARTSRLQPPHQPPHHAPDGPVGR